MLGTEFIQRFERYCPLSMAMEGDPCGLHIGTLDKEVKKIMVSLDVRPKVVQEAAEKKIDLLVVKHPPIFRPVSRLTEDTAQTKMYLDLIKHDIAVYAAHTNMDIIHDGLNDWFCELLDIKETTFLTKTHEIRMKKLAVFVPVDDAEMMRSALGEAGAGKQGDYINTSYTLTGTGRFTPVGGANPTIGTVGESEKVQEAKIEVIFPETIENQVIEAMYETHPYEDPAFDLYSLDNLAENYGIGRIGVLDTPLKLEDFVQKVKTVFNLNNLRVVHAFDEKETVQRVAICGGSGEKFYTDALKQGADVYITGDVYYHTAHDMQETGMTVIDPGHHIEALCKTKLATKFNKWKNEEGWDVEILASEISTEPFSFE